MCVCAVRCCVIPARCHASAPGHHVQYVAKLSCNEPGAVFVLHCILANIFRYVKAELNAFRLCVESNAFAANAAHQTAFQRRITFSARSVEAHASGQPAFQLRV